MMSRPLWLAVLVVGCSSPPPVVEPATSDPEAMIRQVSAAQCRKILECCGADELERVLGPDTADQANCEAAITAQADAFLLPALQRALEDKTITVEDHEVAGCVAALDARTCDDFHPQASADVLEVEGCTLIVRAKLTLSGFCTDDFECETGFCSHPPADTRGACKNPPQIDEECLQGRCDDFLACSTDGICVEKLGDGEPCGRNADCISDLCSPDEVGMLVCEAAAKVCAG